MSFFSVDSIQDTVHSRNRLAILVYLSTVGQADFVKVQEELELKAPVLSQQLKKLEDVGYVLLNKAIVDGRPKTTVALSALGETALFDHIENLRSLTNRARRQTPPPRSALG